MQPENEIAPFRFISNKKSELLLCSLTSLLTILSNMINQAIFPLPNCDSFTF